MLKRDAKARLQDAVRVGLRMANDPKMPEHLAKQAMENVEKARAALDGIRTREARSAPKPSTR